MAGDLDPGELQRNLLSQGRLSLGPGVVMGASLDLGDSGGWDLADSGYCLDLGSWSEGRVKRGPCLRPRMACWCRGQGCGSGLGGPGGLLHFFPLLVRFLKLH